MKPVNRSLKDGECASGSVNFVTRMGDTVSRPMGHWSPSVHELLVFLEDQRFDYSPRFISIDEENKSERLSYIHGEVELRPWSEELLSLSGLKQIAQMLKQYHEKVSSFTPSDAQWHLSDRKHDINQIIRHGDLGPWNMVWRDKKLVGLIDWDFAEPGAPIEDIAQAAWQCIPLKPAHRCLQTGVSPEQQSERLKHFCDACSVSCQEVIEAVLVIQDLEIERLENHGNNNIEPWSSFLDRGDLNFVKEEKRWLEEQTFF